MKRTLIIIYLTLIGCQLYAVLTPNQEYYIWLNIYEKLLGSNADDTAPALSAFGTNDVSDSYIFVAEDAGKEGYVLLRQKSSGKYFAASSSNTQSTVFENSRSTADRYLWSVNEGTYTYLINKKNSKYLGVDGANKGSSYVNVFYDKPKGSHSQFSVIPVVGSTWDEARAAYVSADYTNEQGVKEVDYCLVKDFNIDRSDTIDIHITANENPIQGTSIINLGSDHTWLILDNIVPSAATSFLNYVTIDGLKATKGSNCRIAIFLNGSAIIPLPKAPMICQGTDGEFELKATNNSDLSMRNNTMTSFTLCRGYMATVASGTKGSGYSRVYVADHADLHVTLPTALSQRVSSVNIKPWQYLSKKGWANSSGSGGADQLRVSWFWSWSAGYDSTEDLEYVPCLQHRYWPSTDDVNSKTATASLSLNEPDHAEQHINCSCGGTTDAWTACTFNGNFLQSGGRIGSPQPTDLNYLTEYFGYVDNLESRCDFAVTHAYWDLGSYNETDYANWFCNTKCKSVWNETGRPLWLSEMEISASWNMTNVTSYEQNRKYLQVLLQKMEECPWIERYAIYGYDMWQTAMFYDFNPSNGLTPAGQVYRDHRSTFAYDAKYTKVPVWWAPSATTPSLVVEQNTSTGKLTFQITNPNTDFTKSLIVERLSKDGTKWEVFAEVEDRYRFDSESISLSDIDAQDTNIEEDQFRVSLTTLSDKTVTSSSTNAGYILNPRIEVDSKKSVPGWTCTLDATNGYTKSTGDTYLEVWDATAANINFNYYQDLTDLEDGIYELSANVFNSLDRVVGVVNGTVGLYAQTLNQFYFTPVTTDAANDPDHPITVSTTDISDLPRITVKNILVMDGKLRIGVRNLGTMSARWAGADNFQLKRVKDDYSESYSLENHIEADSILYALMPETTSGLDASRFIVNPDCNRKDNYGWTASNVDVKTDAESYDGVATNPYWSFWKNGAFTSSLSQEITGLPAGTYTFSALLRGQDTTTMQLTAKTDEENFVTQSFTGKGAESYDGDAYPQGWNLITTDSITISQGQTLTISLNTESTASAWWSADHFALTLVEKSTEQGETIDTPKKYLLTYLVDGVIVQSDSVEVNTKLTPREEPMKEGYTFSGWSEIPATMPAHDVFVTGSFTINKYLLTYEVDGVTIQSDSVTYATTLTPREEPTKEGYIFSGWSNIPATMPAHDVTVTGSFILDTFVLDSMSFKVTDTNNTTVTLVSFPESSDVVVPESIQYQDKTYSVTAIADNAFAGQPQLKSVKIPSSVKAAGKNLFEGSPHLAAITWEAPMKMTRDMAGSIADNPNLLFYTSNMVYAPDGVTNIINLQTKQAERIVLTDDGDNNDFYCPEEFTASSISYTHEYQLFTVTGQCQGWESLVLPFNVTEMTHETNGIITPFGALQIGREFDNGTKPFWLYEYTTGGSFTEAESIEANVPYILSMPNEVRFSDEYILAGSVTFKGTNVTVKATSGAKTVKSGNYSFTPSYQNGTQKTVYLLNVEKKYDGNPKGSVFVKNDLLERQPHPFEAYFQLSGSAGVKSFFSIFDELTDGIRSIEPAKRNANAEYYQLDGTKHDKIQRGFNIIRTTDGKVQKILMK